MDVLGLEKEKISGKPLLIKVVENGRIIRDPVPLNRIRDLVKDNLSKFPEAMKSVYSRYKYPVIISPGLKKLRRTLAVQLAVRQ